jgi:hypothetical protein
VAIPRSATRPQNLQLDGLCHDHPVRVALPPLLRCDRDALDKRGNASHRARRRPRPGQWRLGPTDLACPLIEALVTNERGQEMPVWFLLAPSCLNGGQERVPAVTHGARSPFNEHPRPLAEGAPLVAAAAGTTISLG